MYNMYNILCTICVQYMYNMYNILYIIYCTPGLVDQEDMQGNAVSGSWRNETVPEGFVNFVPQCYGNNVSKSGKYYRDIFRDYFMKEEAVQ